jgi:hypothetical protein
VLYLHASPRSEGLDYLRSRSSSENSKAEATYCASVGRSQQPPLVNDTAMSGVGRDLLTPEAVRDWNPDALVFEDGFFLGVPKMPPALFDELEVREAVAVIEVPPHEYHGRKDEYDSFLRDRPYTSKPPIGMSRRVAEASRVATSRRRSTCCASTRRLRTTACSRA